MGYLVQARDLTEQYRSYGRILSDYRPLPSTTFLPGMNCRLVPQDSMVYPDAATVGLAFQAATNNNALIGVVSEAWPGFANPGPGLAYVNLSPAANPAIRGTQGVLLVVRGFHPAILVQTGGGTPAIVDGTILIPGNLGGYSWGSATVPPRGMVDGVTAIAMLPTTGPITSIPSGTGALTAASRVITTSIVGTVGDTVGVTLTLPNGDSRTYQVTLTPTNSIPATALTNVLNADSWFRRYFTATAGSTTITLNCSPQGTMLVPYPTKYGTTDVFQCTLSGAIGNLVGISVFKLGSGVTTISVPGPNFISGLLYQGTVPGFVIGGLC